MPAVTDFFSAEVMGGAIDRVVVALGRMVCFGCGKLDLVWERSLDRWAEFDEYVVDEVDIDGLGIRLGRAALLRKIGTTVIVDVEMLLVELALRVSKKKKKKVIIERDNPNSYQIDVG